MNFVSQSLPRCIRIYSIVTPLRNFQLHAALMVGEPGSGAGKGGGSGGSVRDAGGSFGKMEAAREDEYFRRLQKLQLKNLRSHVDEELEHHLQQLKHHQEAIERHKKRQKELDAEAKSIDGH